MAFALCLGFSQLVAAGSDDISARKTAGLNSWLDTQYEQELQLSPVRMTMLGRKDRCDEIDDASEGAVLDQYHQLERSVAQLQRQFDYEKLSPEGKVSYNYCRPFT